MPENAKLNLLDEELDAESQKYIQESLDNWKESVVNNLIQEMEEVKQAKIEELEEQNLAYRAELKEEFTEKMLANLEELKESIRAEVTAEVIRNNPELKILEQVKELVAPLLGEEYRNSTYEDAIFKLSQENEQLKREQEINEGAKTLANLLAPYSENVQKIVVSLIKEGSPEEVTEQFLNIYDSLSNIFEAEKADDEDEDTSDEEDTEDADEADDSDEDNEDTEDDSDDEDEDVKESHEEDESFINEGYEGFDTYESEKRNSTRNILKAYANL
jgi:hypothetical protein